MMNGKVNIDKVFRDRLEGFSAEPPVHVWNNIHDGLVFGKRKRRIARYSRIAVAALIVLAFVAGFYFNRISNDSISQTAETVNNKIKEDSGIFKKSEAERSVDSKGIGIINEKPESALVAGITPESGSDRPVKYINKPAGEVGTETEISLSDKVATSRSIIKRLKVIKADLKQKENKPGLLKQIAQRTIEGQEYPERRIIAANDIPAKTGLESGAGWKMGLHVSPGYSSHSSSHGSVYADNMTYSSSDGNGNISGGVSVQYQTGKRWSIESGIFYSQNGQRSGSLPVAYDNYADNQVLSGSAEKLYFNPGIDVTGSRMAMNSVAGVIEFEKMPDGAELAATLDRTETNSKALLTSGEFSQIFDFVEIPFYLRYLLFSSIMDIELVGGVNAGLVIGNNAYLNNEYGLQKIGNTRDISPVNISGTFGIGLAYSLGKHISLSVEPRINYYLNSINSNPDVDYRPYRVGVYTGLYYEF